MLKIPLPVILGSFLGVSQKSALEKWIWSQRLLVFHPQMEFIGIW